MEVIPPKKPRPAPPATGRWKPGQSGNPLGRPKSKPFKEELERIIAQDGLARAAAALVARANSGDVAALKELADRLDGRVPHAIGGTNDLPAISHIVTGVIRPQDEDNSLESQSGGSDLAHDRASTARIEDNSGEPTVLSTDQSSKSYSID